MVVPLLTKETRTWHEATPADEIEQRRSLRVFSDHRNAGDMVLSFLRLTGDGQLEIVWQDDQGSLHDLDADLHEYFRAAGDLVGWFGWQSLYADVRLSDDRWRTVVRASRPCSRRDRGCCRPSTWTAIARGSQRGSEALEAIPAERRARDVASAAFESLSVPASTLCKPSGRFARQRSERVGAPRNAARTSATRRRS